MTRTAADLLVECLEAEGVRHVFGIPGEETLELNDSLERSSIEFVPVRHEQGASFIADVYGRLTGRAGVCLATLGPGATNLLTGVADAYLDRAPLVALTGQVGLERMHKESHQYIDVVSLMRPVTKWNARITDARTVPEMVRKAFKVAEEEKPGATHLELPENVMADAVEGGPLRRVEPARPRPADVDVDRAVALLRDAERPVILAGNGAVRDHAAPALRAFAAHTNVPVATTFMGKGLLDAEDPLALGAVGLQARDYVLAGFDEADLVVTVGYDLVEHAPRNWNPRADKSIICIDSLPAEIDDHFIPEVELVGDIAYSLQVLAERCGVLKPAPRGQSALHRAIERTMVGAVGDDSFPMRPGRLVAELHQVLGRHDILVSDVGLHKLWIGRMYRASEPNTVLIANGLAGMGFAVPAAIAAKLVHPEAKVVAVSGDGGFLMNAQELETAKRMRTPFVNVVWENGQFGSIVWKQERRFGTHFGTDFTNPDFVGLAASFGLPAWRVQSASEFAVLLDKAMALDVPSLIAVPVEYQPDLALVDGLGEETAPT